MEVVITRYLIYATLMVHLYLAGFKEVGKFGLREQFKTTYKERSCLLWFSLSNLKKLLGCETELGMILLFTIFLMVHKKVSGLSDTIKAHQVLPTY